MAPHAGSMSEDHNPLALLSPQSLQAHRVLISQLTALRAYDEATANLA